MNRIRGKVPQFSVIIVRAATTTDVDTPRCTFYTVSRTGVLSRHNVDYNVGELCVRPFYVSRPFA